MLPVLLSIGPISIYTAHILAVLGWFLFAFLFWRQLRMQGVLEERIFDLIFYATIIGTITARLGFVVLYPQLFSSSLLLIGAFWVQPGLWFYSGLVGVLLTFYLFAKRFHLRFAHVFDAFVYSLPWTLLFMSLGGFFQGDVVGRVTNLPWAVILSGVEGKRHPVQLYEALAVIILGLILVILYKQAQIRKWPVGLLGGIGLMMISPVLFGLEFLKDASLYLYGITYNQWILILVFAESIGSVIIKLRRLGIIPKRGVQYESKSSESGTSDGTEKSTGGESSGDQETTG